MGKSSRKRERTDEDVADSHDAKPAVKKSKLDINGKAEVTKKSSKVKEAKAEALPVEETPKPKKEKKEKKKEEKEKKAKKEKKEKKSKSKEVNSAAPESDESAPAAAAPSEPEPEVKERANGVDSTDKKSKKQKKKNKDKKTTATAATEETQPENITTADNGDENGAAGDAGGSKQTRFICFVGNLPYTATADSVRAHFATLQPASVRLLTQRDDPSKSRGIAFVEFDRYDRMKTCLSKFHHTEFDDGRSPPRRINVELTAGGGGKTAARREKIKQKNAKLNEERAHRMQKEEEAKHEKAATATADGKTQEQRDEESIHPSRRGRVPYGRN
ncbi:hypothetical protein C7999DRAFT_13216 [Corynascus novoguineensis]|uniref:RRM domain-containing protein n=1 Tax=Corynascus novoguineensis TaxID=1126955 RepID=A0AAN7CX17_9PEZI|nr:hypothetical protein C7999DRAFT_13216 [Corynascus novoguineensis]